MASRKRIVQFSPDKSKTRGGAIKYIGLAIVGLAVLSLVFSSVFAGDGGQVSGRLVFGRYGDKDIIYAYDNAFGQAVANEMARYDNSADQDNQFTDFVRLMAWQQAFSSIALETAIAYHLEESGYEPSARHVDRRIVEYGPYATNGKFDETKYRRASENSKSALRERFTEQLVLETWSRDVLDGTYRSEAQLDFLSEMKSKVRTYDYVSLPFSDYPDDDVISYARENPDTFRELLLSRITVEDEDTAIKVNELLEERRQEIEAFADLAREYSGDPFKEDGGSMGSTPYYRLAELVSTEDAGAVFELKQGEVAGPFDTSSGWMIFKADGEVQSIDPDESADDIRSYMIQNEVGIIEDAMLARAELLRAATAAGESFEDAAAAEGYQVSTTAAFPPNYRGDSLLGGSPENTGDVALSGTAASEEFWIALTPLEEIGDVSRPVVLSDSIGIFVLNSVEVEDAGEYWESTVTYETARSKQTEFQAAVLSDDSKLFVDRFNETYRRVFPSEQ